ncbi:MerR family transcriptional regulator [Nocardia sp. NPDC057668]|uniref:MerR family transcriptional regulator n=1 Tax=Nocardia sp. NPDC057668 TaxID=3346202 RepID=UPI00366ED306
MAGESEYTIDDLARAADTTVRSVRVYHERGLLPSPEVRGRVGYYDSDHLHRLQTISRLLGRGMRLNGIRELLEAWDRGDGLGEVLGVTSTNENPPDRGHTFEFEPPSQSVTNAPAPWCAELSARLTEIGATPSDVERLLQQLAEDCGRLAEHCANELLLRLLGAEHEEVPRSMGERRRLEAKRAAVRTVVAQAAAELIDRAIDRYCDSPPGIPGN